MISFYLYQFIIAHRDVKYIMFIIRNRGEPMDAPVHAAFTLAADRVPLVQQRAFQVRYTMRIHCTVFLSPGAGTAACGFVC